MNKIYRIVFNAMAGRWVVASEMAKGRKKASRSVVAGAAATVVVLGLLGGVANASIIDATGQPAGTSASVCGEAAVDGSGFWSTVAGCGASGSGMDAVTAFGYHATGSANNTVVFGADALAQAFSGTAVGASATVTTGATNAVALGAGSVATEANTVSLGRTANVPGGGGIDAQYTGALTRRMVNMSAGINDNDAVNVSQLKGVTTALGGGADVNATTGAAIAPSYALPKAIAINGSGSAATNVGTAFTTVDNALGNLNTSVTKTNRYFKAGGTGDGSDDASVSGGVAIAIGADSVSGFNGATRTWSSVAVGVGARATTLASTAIGSGAQAINGNTTALGVEATASGGNAGAFGVGANAGATYSTAIGNYANASTQYSVALGAYSTTTADLTQPGYNPGTAALAGTASTAHGEVSIGKAGSERRLTNLAAGSAATDAVNVSQLQAEDATVDKLGADTAAALGGTATYDAATGAISAPEYTVHNPDGTTTTTYNDVKSVVTNVDGRVTAITNQLNSGTVGLVQQAAPGANLTVGAGTDGAAVNFAGTAGARKLINVAAGVGTNDAVNVSQLQPVVAALGGGATIDATTGAVTGPTYTVHKADGTDGTEPVNTVGAAISNIDGRVYNNTTAISDLNQQLASGEIGLVQQNATTKVVTVAAGKQGTEVNFAGIDGERTLTGVANGLVEADSKQAVNGGQLYGVSSSMAAAIGGESQVKADGTITAPAYTVTQANGTATTVTGVEGAITQIDGRVADNTTDIAVNKDAIDNLNQQLADGSVGLVQYDDTAGLVAVAAGKAGSTVSFANNAGLARRLSGVAKGVGDEDAVNVSQLKPVIDALGGGASIDPATGVVIGPKYEVTDANGVKSEVTTVGGAISNIDNRVYNNTTQISTISNQLANGEIGLVKQDADTQLVTVANDKGGTEVNFAGTDGERKLTGVADGKVEAGSKEAVNGGQLHGVSSSIASAIGGDATVNPDGTVSAPNYTVTNVDGTTTTVHNMGDAISNIDNRVYNTQTQVDHLTTQLESGEVGMVQQAGGGAQLTVGKDTDGTAVNFAGTAGDRTLTGVAAAKADNDAVNLGQLKSAGVIGANGESKSVVTYDNSTKTSITMGEPGNGPVVIHNVAQGTANTDAVNVEQLNDRLARGNAETLSQANAYTDQRIDDVWGGMNKVVDELGRQDRRISDVGAMAMAEAQMTSNAAAASVGNPAGAWAVGMGFMSGRAAMSAGYAKPVGKKSRISFGASFNGREQSVGIGFGQSL